MYQIFWHNWHDNPFEASVAGSQRMCFRLFCRMKEKKKKKQRATSKRNNMMYIIREGFPFTATTAPINARFGDFSKSFGAAQTRQQPEKQMKQKSAVKVTQA